MPDISAKDLVSGYNATVDVDRNYNYLDLLKFHADKNGDGDTTLSEAKKFIKKTHKDLRIFMNVGGKYPNYENINSFRKLLKNQKVSQEVGLTQADFDTMKDPDKDIKYLSFQEASDFLKIHAFDTLNIVSEAASSEGQSEFTPEQKKQIEIFKLNTRIYLKAARDAVSLQ